jgi:hypothetical protein
MADFRTSLLVNRQVPEFIREEYPLFITFLEAYYEFLEQKQGTQLNDLTNQAKTLRNLPDVDESIEEFETQFFNTYASLLPKDAVIDKAALIKNVLPLYLAKGSENSFKLLFRMMFGQELEVSYPKNDVLRASDGKWLIENTIKVLTEAFTRYTGDGSKKEFLLGACRCPITTQPLPVNVTVYFNGVLQTSGFYVRQETKKLVFDVAPTTGTIIEIYYRGFDFDSLVNRKLTGLKSGATTIVEKIGSQIINNRTIIDLYVATKNILGNFSIGEEIDTNIFHQSGELVPISLKTFSSIFSIEIVDGGSNYNVGDPVNIVVPVAEEQPTAFISKTFSGKVNQVIISDGGAGFQVAANVDAIDFDRTQLFFAVGQVNSSGRNTANTFTIYSDVISDIDPANTYLLSSDWYFESNISPSGVVNVNSTISHAFGNVSYTTIGEISNVQVLISEAAVTTTPVLNAEPAIVLIPPRANTVTNTIVKIDTFGSLAKCNIFSGGINYQIGDELVFTNPSMSFGVGAEAEVANVNLNGTITKVEFKPNKITGTANVTSVSNVMVQGNSTLFEVELIPGDEVMINNEVRKVISVASNTSMNVNSPFSEIFSEEKVRKLGIYPVGGQGYRQDKLPSVSVVSANGSDANIVVTAIMGDGENLIARGTGRAGEIQEIVITNPGETIKVIPSIDLSSFGDGTAIADVTLNPIINQLDGRWTTSDSILSSADRKIQGRDYYINQSYLLSSGIEFAKYKKIFKELLHPAGFKPYAELNKLDILVANNTTLNTVTVPKTIRTISGTVNVNSSIFVVGTGTKFNIANNLGLLTVGSYIAINSEVRIVDSIVSNTQLTVSVPFTITANNQELVVINTVYEAIATEVTLDEIIAENELVLTIES